MYNDSQGLYLTKITFDIGKRQLTLGSTTTVLSSAETVLLGLILFILSSIININWSEALYEKTCIQA